MIINYVTGEWLQKFSYVTKEKKMIVLYDKDNYDPDSFTFRERDVKFEGQWIHEDDNNQNYYLDTEYEEYDDPELHERLLFNAVKLLVKRKEEKAASLLITLDSEIACIDLSGKKHALIVNTDVESYEYFRDTVTFDYLSKGAQKTKGIHPEEYNAKEANYKRHIEIYKSIVTTLNELGTPYKIYVEIMTAKLDLEAPPTDWRKDADTIINAIYSNQGAKFWDYDGERLKHDDLRFRSHTEIIIYKELVKRGLLIMPLPKTVMGKRKKNKEPDFVVIYEGIAGILEVNGPHHKRKEQQKKDKQKKQLFLDLGVAVYAEYNWELCQNSPESVVDNFIKRLDKYLDMPAIGDDYQDF